MRLTDALDTTYTGGPCHRLFSVCGQGPSTRVQSSGLDRLRRVVGARSGERPIAVLCPFFLFLGKWEEGASAGIPTCQHKGVVGKSRGGQSVKDTSLGMEYSESLLLSGLCRLRATAPPRKHSHLTVCGLRVQALTHSLTHESATAQCTVPARATRTPVCAWAQRCGFQVRGFRSSSLPPLRVEYLRR